MSVNKKQEKEMIKIIPKEKNKLISLDNPVKFIFANTSLGIGRDFFNIHFLKKIDNIIAYKIRLVFFQKIFIKLKIA